MASRSDNLKRALETYDALPLEAKRQAALNVATVVAPPVMERQKAEIDLGDTLGLQAVVNVLSDIAPDVFDDHADLLKNPVVDHFRNVQRAAAPVAANLRALYPATKQ